MTGWGRDVKLHETVMPADVIARFTVGRARQSRFARNPNSVWKLVSLHIY